MQCLCFSVNAETDRVVQVEVGMFSKPAEIEIFEGEQVQLVFPGSSDLDNKRYIHYYSGEKKATVSQNLKLTGYCAGVDYMTIYLGYEFPEEINLIVNVKPNNNISYENRFELDRLNNFIYENFLRKKMELYNMIDKNTPRLDMEKVNAIINTSENFDEIIARCQEYHGYPDLISYLYDSTHYIFWLDDKGNEQIIFNEELRMIYYSKVDDSGTIIGNQVLYPEETEFYEYNDVRYKDYSYITYNQVKPEGNGILNLKFIDGSTGEAFTETNGKFQLISNDNEVIKSWNASAGSEITISDLSRESTYEIRYIDDYHGDFPYDQQYKYEIDHDKGASRFSFGYNDDEVSYNVYLKKRHRVDPYLLGDVNSDNMINIADLVALQNWLLGKPNAVLMNWRAADLCGDGVLNSFDMCLMKKALIENNSSVF